MKESLEAMMHRVKDGVPGPHWVQTSVGLVNTRNESKVDAAARKLIALKQASDSKGGQQK